MKPGNLLALEVSEKGANSCRKVIFLRDKRGKLEKCQAASSYLRRGFFNCLLGWYPAWE
ncbi:hypothetical protein KKC1_23810 [Calderihabitans maritimus]|uniref:Uncharacterized protein n=1 Tax=Calderihabitans maritimus TaxID=1246530 RepID=A0A1Z5HUQ3_9FIRM|nr:hypothetical protein KKC1_23810 [Calderihabitans maritimus]